MFRRNLMNRLRQVRLAQFHKWDLWVIITSILTITYPNYLTYAGKIQIMKSGVMLMRLANGKSYHVWLYSVSNYP